ncbi:Vps51/Vps67-domain-containing protein [Podospora aff. communis PSN243]|uniref:Vacuolar protein sorting-associated protein 51 homolog n=1 Tax=Podospora aff. communis PSN243 TaxID=3040156 RepID=A0AAV9GA28_9PEZI|nr:Vps51/Vps67-domain-containing protein [Podospora aff. communis PSN243]
MSTIASPRDPSSTPLTRRINPPPRDSSVTPTSSTRPSLDINPSSTSSSPNPNTTHTLNPLPPRTSRAANRAALREHYNLKKASASNPGTPTVEINPPPSPHLDGSIPPSPLDAPDFDATSYIASTLANSSLSELLRTYARILGEIRALDAEKKALVYDNYSKLISATETIRRMRSTMDPLNPMAGTLDLVVAKIYEQASGLREGLRREVPEPKKDDRRKRTRELAREVLAVPERLRGLVEEGRVEEAKREWKVPRRLLERWRERGLGGGGVDKLIEEGDAIVGRGEEESGSESESEGSGEDNTT